MRSATNVADLLRERAADDPGSVALRVGADQALTLGAWEERSNAVARGLAARGVRPGDRVVLAFEERRWADHAVGYMGVLKAGAVAVPVGSRFTGPELDAVLAHAEPAGLLGRPATAPAGPWWAAELSEMEDANDRAAFQVAVDADDLAEILYTSGTTGTSKGVACTHRSIMAHDLPADGTATATGAVAFLHAFPIGTQAGQETLRVPLRIARRTAIALPTFDPELACALVAEHGVARLQLVPAMAQVLVASGAAARHDVSSVRRVILSSAHAPPALFVRLQEAFPAATLWNAYAMTEAGSARTLTRWDAARPASVGLPVGQTEVRIVGEPGPERPDGAGDPGPERPDGAGKAGDPVPAGEVGEVWLRRRGTPTRWYHRDPAATAAVFVDGWVRTGDLGHLDEAGHLHLDDRKKDLIISGGRNISSVEVEDALSEHPEVREAAVFGAVHPVLGEDVAAAVVAGPATSVRELQDLVRSRLAEHKVPRRIVLVDELPRNASGKVVKGELRRRFGSAGMAAPFVAPDRGLEPLVAGVWAEVLALAQVGADDDFFALGGHSLAAAQIAARLGDSLGVAVPLALVFEAPTVAEQAKALSALMPSGPAGA